MPIFHFEVRTDTHVLNTNGVELVDHTAARAEAARRIGALLSDHADQIWSDQNWQMDVTDANGLILYVLHVMATKAPATTDSRQNSN